MTPHKMMGKVFLSLVWLGTAGCALRTPQPSCILSNARSAVSWAIEGTEIHGVVLRVETSEPVMGASAQLSPGDLSAVTDSAGRFRFASVPAGKYQIRIRAFGLIEARDSITYGLGGLNLVAALSSPPAGLRECAFWTPPHAH